MRGDAPIPSDSIHWNWQCLAQFHAGVSQTRPDRPLPAVSCGERTRAENTRLWPAPAESLLMSSYSVTNPGPTIGAYRNLTATFLRYRDASRAHSRPFNGGAKGACHAPQLDRVTRPTLGLQGGCRG